MASAIMDLFNGSVVRPNMASSGKCLLDDSIFDRLADVSIYAGIMYAHYLTSVVVLFTLPLSLLPSYMRAKGESLGIKITFFGIGERSDRMLTLICSFFLATYP